MRTHSVRLIVSAAALGLLAVACEGGTAEISGTAGATVAPANAGAPDSIALRPDDPSVVARVSELAVALVGQLGDDETAVGALLLAGDAGYSGPQIEDAIVRASLSADGKIAGAQPAFEPYGLIEGFHPMIIGQDVDKPLPIERFQQEAIEQSGRDDDFLVGTAATAQILRWQLTGFSQAQIVEMLILGYADLDGYDGPFDEGYEECPSWVIGGVQESAKFCDPENGELYPDEEEEAPPPVPAAAVPAPGEGGEGVEACDGDFAPPYTVALLPAGAMLETEILGPLETPYYYTETSGFLDLNADGSISFSAHTVRYADITIRGDPDNQIYIRDMTATGSLDTGTGDGVLAGSGKGTDQLWADDDPAPREGVVNGEIALLCDADEASDWAIFGFVSGPGGFIEFEARP